MKKLRIKIILAGIFCLSVMILKFNYFTHNSTVEAAGDLSIVFGSSHTDSSLFHIENMAPGDIISKQVTVYNDASTGRSVGVRGIRRTETGDLSKALSIQITHNGVSLYGGQNSTKTLQEFFSESSGSEGVLLSDISPGNKKTYIFTVRFQPAAGNEFQSKRLTFDLQMGVFIKLPLTCENLHISTKPIYGTKRRDILTGTHGNDLIMGFEGNDIIDGKGGSDCIIGSEGNDIISGGNGEDIIFGGNGRDILKGGAGYDNVTGGQGIDICEGESKSGCEL